MITDINKLDMQGSYTYADYLTWQFSEMVELIKGKIYRMSPAPLSYHQQLVGRFTVEFGTYFKKHKCSFFPAPFDVRLQNNKTEDNEITTVVQPDFCIVCDESKIDKRGCLGAPDLIIEILSGSTAKKDFNEKFLLYEENKVREYWIVNPDAKQVYQYALQENEKLQEIGIFESSEIIQTNIFPNLYIPLAEIFY